MSDTEPGTDTEPPAPGGGMEPLEQKVGFGLAAAAALAFPALWLTTNADGSVVAAGAVVSVVFAALLALAARSRRRFPTLLVAVTATMAIPAKLALLGLPYLGFSAWLMFKHTREARERAEIKARARREAKAAKAVGAGGREGATTRTRPAPSKRYTPPQKRR